MTHLIMITAPYNNLIRILSRTFFLHNGLSHSITTVLNFYHRFPLHDFLIKYLHIFACLHHIWYFYLSTEDGNFEEKLQEYVINYYLE